MNDSLSIFCSKWLEVLTNPNFQDFDYIENMKFPDECREQGFVMDCGKSFVEKYGEEVWNNPQLLQENIEQINDVIILGSGIFSQWRYYSHWAMAPFKGSEIEEWTVIAFNRLKDLSEN